VQVARNGVCGKIEGLPKLKIKNQFSLTYLEDAIREARRMVFGVYVSPSPHYRTGVRVRGKQPILTAHGSLHRNNECEALQP
jgi:hypothetical protein